MVEEPAPRLGVSLVICTYNGASRLPETLHRLHLQQVAPGVSWEVIVVNNASTDETEAVAKKSWRGRGGVSFTVINEPKPGLTEARARGVREAKYEIVSFIDDDNRVSANWVGTLSDLMSSRPEIGACGGMCDPVFESEPPAWFDLYRGNYVIGTQGARAGDVTEERGWLWGAGLSIRKSVWLRLEEHGFAPMLRDREGEKLSSCGDIEISYAIRLAGYRLWYEPSLKIDHLIPGRRLDWNYVLSLYEGVGAATLSLDCYEQLLAPRADGVRNRLRRTWQYQALASMKLFMGSIVMRRMYTPGSPEHRKSACSARFFSARLRALLGMRGRYDASLKAMASARWISQRPATEGK
ncbi:MAG: glycosyltransferase [Blastocatellia bacterium]